MDRRSVRGSSKRNRVSMTRGLRDHGPRRIDARPNHDTFVNGAFEPEYGSTQITHCGETPHQRRLSLSSSQKMEVGNGSEGHDELAEVSPP